MVHRIITIGTYHSSMLFPVCSEPRKLLSESGDVLQMTLFYSEAGKEGNETHVGTDPQGYVLAFCP